MIGDFCCGEYIVAEFDELCLLRRHSVKSLVVGFEVDCFHGGIRPLVAGLDVLEQGWFGEDVSDGHFEPGVDCSTCDVKLSGIGLDPGNCWSVLGVDGLMEDRFVVGVAIELGVQWEFVILRVVVLVTFDMLYEDLAWELM